MPAHWSPSLRERPAACSFSLRHDHEQGHRPGNCVPRAGVMARPLASRPVPGDLRREARLGPALRCSAGFGVALRCRGQGWSCPRAVGLALRPGGPGLHVILSPGRPARAAPDPPPGGRDGDVACRSAVVRGFHDKPLTTGVSAPTQGRARPSVPGGERGAAGRMAGKPLVRMSPPDAPARAIRWVMAARPDDFLRVRPAPLSAAGWNR